MGSMGKGTLAALAMMGLLKAPLAAQASIAAAQQRPVQVRVAASAIELDGVLDEQAWADASSIPLPWEIVPGNNEPARLDTDCRLTFDDENLYFGCRASDDDVDLIRAFLTDRDDIGGQDQVGLMIDPFRDQRRSFAFVMSPLGVQSDSRRPIRRRGAPPSARGCRLHLAARAYGPRTSSSSWDRSSTSACLGPVPGE